MNDTRMVSLKADCPCGVSVESAGRDESSRNSIREFKRDHDGHTRPTSGATNV